MNTLMSVLFIYAACVSSICSAEKMIEKTKEKKVEKELEKDLEKELEKEKEVYHLNRKVFANKDEIPKEYIDDLIDYYDIQEDPYALEEQQLRDYSQYVLENGQNNKDDETKTDSKDDKKVETKSKTTDTNIMDSGDNSTCKSCVERSENKKMRLQSIKSSILTKIGFSDTNLPNMTGKSFPKIPSLQKIIESYDMMSDAPYEVQDEFLPDDEYYGQIQRAFTVSQLPPDEFNINVPGGCYFDIPESVTSRRVKEAKLWIYLEKPENDKKRVTEIFLHIIPEKAKPKYLRKSRVRYSKTSSFGWQEIKFTHDAHSWIKHANANKGIIIRALDEYGDNVAITPGNDENKKYFPMLEMVTVQHSEKHRNKRSIPYICSETQVPRVETCCRYPLRVDFVNFGWDWVIAPTGYMANYCSGECRYRHMDNNPQAYLIQQTPGSQGPCCTPDKMYPLAMLYFDHHQTVLYTYMQKMIVMRCGCA